MTYSVGGLIQATDFNGLVNTGATNLNTIWSTGAGDSGYGQTAIATVTAGNKVFAAPEWNALITTITKVAAHQGTALSAWTNSNPVTGDIIRYETNMATNLGLINTSRLNAAAQGATSSTTATSASTWGDSLTFTFTITFASANAARWFFNAGGQISIQTAHPPGVVFDIDQLISDICSDAGTVWLSSPTSGTATLAGTAYNGVTQVGGGYPAGATVGTNSGFGALSAVATQLLKQFGNFAYHAYTATSFLEISATHNAGVVTVTAVLDEIPNGATVSTGTTATLTVRPPSTTNLTNTWGTPTVTSTVTAV